MARKNLFFWFSSSQILTNVFEKSPDSFGSSMQPKMWKGLKSFLLSYLVYSQIWLNFLVDDHRFGYITKLKKTKTCSQTVPLLWPAFVLGAKFRQNAKKIIGDIIKLVFLLSRHVLLYTYRHLMLNLSWDARQDATSENWNISWEKNKGGHSFILWVLHFSKEPKY
jgi:hypothetical protein